MNDPMFIALATIALIVLSAVCVVIEFALLGARRHRLEELAADSRSARAAWLGRPAASRWATASSGSSPPTNWTYGTW